MCAATLLGARLASDEPAAVDEDAEDDNVGRRAGEDRRDRVPRCALAANGDAIFFAITVSTSPNTQSMKASMWPSSEMPRYWRSFYVIERPEHPHAHLALGGRGVRSVELDWLIRRVYRDVVITSAQWSTPTNGRAGLSGVRAIEIPIYVLKFEDASTDPNLETSPSAYGDQTSPRWSS